MTILSRTNHLTSLLRSLPAHNFLLYLSVECFTGISDSGSFPHTIPEPDSPQYMALPYIQLFKEDTLELSLTLSSLSFAPYFLYFLSQTLYFALFLAAISLFQPITSLLKELLYRMLISTFAWLQSVPSLRLCCPIW